MRTVAAVILIALLSSVLVPSILVLPGSSGEGEVAIGLLDVCHKSMSGVTPDLPFLAVCPCIIAPVSAGEIAPLCEHAINPLLFVRPIEEPPVVLS
jgi:hypothetical protein